MSRHQGGAGSRGLSLQVPGPSEWGTEVDELASPSQLFWAPVFQQVHRIVNQALKRYSEDRIGMVDYALESGGVSSLPPFAGPPLPHTAGPLAYAGAAMVLSKQGLKSAEIRTQNSPQRRATVGEGGIYTEGDPSPGRADAYCCSVVWDRWKDLS